jgi:hypothetical protein
LEKTRDTEKLMQMKALITERVRLTRWTLRKRAEIETVSDFLKNTCQVEHSRHRSVITFLVTLLGAISAYSFLSKKPSIHGFDDERALPILA